MLFAAQGGLGARDEDQPVTTQHYQDEIMTVGYGLALQLEKGWHALRILQGLLYVCPINKT